MTGSTRRIVVAALLVGGLAVVSLGVLDLATGAVGPPDTPVEAWVERQKFTPDDAEEPGWGGNPSHWGVAFGSEIALDGDTVVVGTQETMSASSGSGDGHDWAYVFNRNEQGHWSQTSKLIPSDAQQGDSFAFSLDLDEEAGVLVAGNPGGQKIYIFERMSNGTWDEVQLFERDREIFGYDVAVSGDTVVAYGSNRLLLFERGSSGWTEVGAIPDAVAPVDLVGDTLTAAPLPNYKDMAVYKRDGGGEWTRRAELPQPPASPSGDPVHGDVELSEDAGTILVGAGTDSRVLGTSNGRIEMAASGSAWIYELQDGEWEMTAEISNPDPWPFDNFGHSVDLAGDRAVIGAYGDTQNGADGAGAVYVVDRMGGEWAVTSKLRNSDGPPWGGTDFFGESVGISGDTIVAGAPWDDNRRDGVPPPLDDEAKPPGCRSEEVALECGEGMGAGSVYVFEPADRVIAETVG